MKFKGQGYRRSILTALGLGSLYRRIDDLNSQVAALQNTAAIDLTDQHIHLDHGVSPRVRYGLGRPSHAELARRIGANKNAYVDLAHKLSSLIPNLKKIENDATDLTEPQWNNPWLSPFDATSVYGMISLKNPDRFIEIGSGTTTKLRDELSRIKISKQRSYRSIPFPEARSIPSATR